MDGTYAAGFRQRPAWLLAILVVAVGQAGLAGRLFDADTPWAALGDDRPVTDGRHPLHLYHGGLGAATFRTWSATTCYDPDFQAGYPKTPVFDSGSRPAELALYLFGGAEVNPAAYKLGLFLTALLAPLAFAAAARGFGLPAAAAVLAGVGGCAVWWSPPMQAAFLAGQQDALIYGLAALVFLGGFARYIADPGVTGWVMMALSAVVGWYVHPVAWAGLLPVVAAMYVVHAPRHGPAWHLGLLAVFVVGAGPNLWWLKDWVWFWSLRQPVGDDGSLPSAVELVGGVSDYLAIFGPGPLGWAAVAVGLVGLVAMVRKGLTGPVGVIAAAAVLAVAVARLGDVWPLAKAVNAHRAAVLVPAIAVFPTAFLLCQLLARFKLRTAVVLAAVGLPVFAGWVMPGVLKPFAVTPLRVGFTPTQLALMDDIKRLTTPDARLLIEEPDATKSGWNWTALIPHRTDVPCLGGIDQDACVEHLFAGLCDGKLAGQVFAKWTDADRARFCRRYNVGWVLARTPDAVAWWTADPTARVVRPADADGWALIQLDRPHSYFLAGSGTLERADARQLVLTDLVPDAGGDVILSFHYQKELRVAPGTVFVYDKGGQDALDPIPFINLKLLGPVSRVTLTWEHP